MASLFIPSLHLHHEKTLKTGAGGTFLHFPPRRALSLNFVTFERSLAVWPWRWPWGWWGFLSPLFPVYLGSHFISDKSQTSLARCCFWPPALAAVYIFQVSMQSRKGHLQGNPICSTKRVPAPHHKSHGWPSGEDGKMGPVGPRGLRQKMAQDSIQHPACVLKNNRNHSLHYSSKTF